VLLAAGVITDAMLEEALRRQQATGERIGAALIALGYVTDVDIAETLGKQLGLPFLFGDFPVDPNVARLVPEATCRRLQAIPFAREGIRVKVAMVDPLDMAALNDLALATRSEVLPHVATAHDVERAILKVFGAPVEADVSLVAGDSQAVRVVQRLIERAVEDRASDIHIEPLADGVRVRLRVDGVLTEVQRFPRGLLPAVISRIKVLADLDIAERRLPQEGRVELQVAGRTVDLRVATLPTVHGEKAVLRLLDRSQALQTLEELGLAPDDFAQVRAMIARPHGLVLVSGPTGAGKTTTLVACLAEIDARSRNVVTIEDPVEYLLPGLNQTQVNPKIGLTFADGLRAILRQDPDVVMVGEIRDRETAEIAVRAALTGHLVLSSIHTNTAAATPGRLLEMGIEPFLVASSLVGVVAQRLVRRLCVRCRRARAVTAEEARLYGLPGDGTVFEPVGCPHCGNLGYRGRVGVFEVLPVDSLIRAGILDRVPGSELEAAARARGMRSLWEDGVAKALAGVTSLAEVLRVAFAEATP
jgi:type IV pilus assembly protein PilB